MSSSRRAMLSLALLVSGCASTRALPVPTAVKRDAVEYVPVDLDAVVRLDLRRMRSALSNQTLSRLIEFLPPATGSSTSVLARAVAQTDTLWVGVRPSLKPGRWDNVFVLEGHFSKIPESELIRVFRPARDLGDGWSVQDVRKVESRTAPARLYRYRETRWIFASVAEMDALARVVQRKKFERSFEPKARGVFSFAASFRDVDDLALDVAPNLAPAFRDLAQLEGELSLGENGVTARTRLGFSDDAAALRAQGLFSRLAEALLGRRLELSLSRTGSDVSLVLLIPPSWLAQALRQGSVSL